MNQIPCKRQTSNGKLSKSASVKSHLKFHCTEMEPFQRLPRVQYVALLAAQILLAEHTPWHWPGYWHSEMSLFVFFIER